MSERIKFMLSHFDRTKVQLSPEDQKCFDLPKFTTVGEVRKAVAMIEAEVPEEDTMEMIVEPSDETQL